MARLTSGALEVAYASTDGALTYAGPSGSTITTQILRAGSSPSITTLTGGGYELAGVGTDGDLHVWGTAGDLDFKLPVVAGSNPAIAGLKGGSYEVAYAGPGGYLEVANSAGATTWLGYPLAANTSPAITALSGGSFEIAGQSYTGELLVYGPTGAQNLGVAMGSGASLSIAAGTNNCFDVAYRNSSGLLAAGGCSVGISAFSGWPFAVGTDPTVVSTGGAGWQVAMQGSNRQVWEFTSTGSTWSEGVVMRPGSSPTLA
jgi:hypothetical protein